MIIQKHDAHWKAGDHNFSMSIIWGLYVQRNTYLQCHNIINENISTIIELIYICVFLSKFVFDGIQIRLYLFLFDLIIWLLGVRGTWSCLLTLTSLCWCGRGWWSWPVLKNMWQIRYGKTVATANGKTSKEAITKCG